MGKLVRLEVYNFKSYKGHHVLLFGDAYFTSVIGPNGSGKSNSMDAISFVLGIKSSHLRSNNLKDLIYRGRVLKTSKINADGTASDQVNGSSTNGHTNGDTNGDAASDDEPRTQRSSQRIDPTSAWVMAVYMDDGDEEQKWKRSITSSGQSEYRINDHIVSSKEYNQALEAENILIKARNFLVFQGDVEHIASQSARDLTRLVEQISGSLEYKAEYDKRKEEWEKAENEEKFKMQQKRTSAADLKQYREQKEEADAYMRKVDERDQAVVTHVLWKLYHFQRAIDEATNKIQQSQKDIGEQERSVRRFEKQLQDATQEQAKTKQSVGKMERAIRRKEDEVEERNTSLVPLDTKIQALSERRLKTYRTRINGLKEEAKVQQQAVDKMKKELDTVRKAQDKSEEDARVAAQEQGRELTDADHREYDRLRLEVTKRVGADQSQVDRLQRQIKTSEEALSSLSSKIQASQDTVTRFEQDMASLNEQKTAKTSIVKDLKQELNAKKKERNEVQSHRAKADQYAQELEEKIRVVLHALRDVTDSRKQSEHERKIQNMVRKLQSQFGRDKVIGTVKQKVEAKEARFEHAILTSLGHLLDAVIVDQEGTGSDCLEALKESRLGVIRVIPLDSVVVQTQLGNLRGMHNKMRPLIDTVKYEPRIERAISFACSNTILCDDLNVARELRFQRKVRAKAVTLDGTIISKGDKMTGGQGPQNKRSRQSGLGESNNEEVLLRQLEEYKSRVENIPRPQKLQEQEEKLAGEVMALEQEIKVAEAQIQSFTRNISDSKKQLDSAKYEMNRNRPIEMQQQQRIESLKDELEQHQESIAEAEDEIFAAFCERLNYDNIRAYEAQQGSLQQELNNKRREFETQRNKLEQQLKFEEDRLKSTNDRLNGLETSSERDKTELESLESKKEEIQEALDELNAELEALNEQLSTVRSELEEKSQMVVTKRADYNKRSKAIDEIKSEMNTYEQEKRKVGGDRYQLLRRCKLDDMKIPLAEDSEPLESLPLDDILQRDPDAMDVDEDPDVTTLQQRSAREYGVEPDFDQLEEDILEDDSHYCEQKLQDNIQSLDTELEKMTPNTRADERLAGVEQRHQEAEREHRTSTKEAMRARDEFDDVREQRLELFNKAFSHISEQIVGTYADLTRSTAYPMGGHASLNMENDDEPYLEGLRYHAMPPLKRFRDMEHLSGGEKTIAALALLFAVHSFQPSPFFVLDEVDAALDNVNVSRVAQYVKDHARPGMQFIVISLKTGLFQESESLVGVMRDQSENTSRVVTLDLRRYRDN